MSESTRWSGREHICCTPEYMQTEPPLARREKSEVSAIVFIFVPAIVVAPFGLLNWNGESLWPHARQL